VLKPAVLAVQPESFGVPGALLCFVNLDTLYGVTGVSVTGMYLLVAIAALLARRGSHARTPAWRMPLWPATPILLIAVLTYVLSLQERNSAGGRPS
jgi:hypothetical protein